MQREPAFMSAATAPGHRVAKPLVVFRVDASVSIGTGHVMRCLTLADALRQRGARCRFLSRRHAGHLLDQIEARGYAVAELPAPDGAAPPPERDGHGLRHAGWLGTDWRTDLAQCRRHLEGAVADWLVVDHYALDAGWEQGMRARCRRLMAIDDLADRAHDCDLLLDQNLGRAPADYAGLAPPHARILAGPRYALLRPEFAELRQRSLQRPRGGQLRRILVAMGGIDEFDATGQVLQALAGCDLPRDCAIWVVMGRNAPWLDRVRARAAAMPRPTQVLAGISDMGARMAASDLAIGAAGGTSWERCCLGLPTLLVVLAENQRAGARALHGAGAAQLLGEIGDIARQLPLALAALPGERLATMSRLAGEVADGRGTGRVLQALEIDGE